jgi:predicted ATPase
MVFYAVAIESNRDSVLVFEEPESHAFPYYTKHLGERIAMDENKNQYFIATHNPYLLAALVEKSPKGDLAVFATYYREFETKVKLLTPEDIQRLYEGDPFLGVEHLLEDEA